MGGSLDEFKLKEKIKLSYLRHRGDLLKVSEEVNLPFEYVKKVCKKIEKTEERNVSEMIANNITSHILMGYQSRVNYLMALVTKTEELEKLLISFCCQAPIRKLECSLENPGGGYECSKCGNLTSIVYNTNEDALSLRLSTLAELRKEDELLTKFAERMGYIKGQLPPGPIIKQQNNYVVMPGAEQLDPEKVKNIEQLSRIEQESLRLVIEKQLAEAEIVEDTDGEAK